MSKHPYAQLSTIDLPQPVVVVVGDHESDFVKKVWSGVLSAHANSPDADAPILWQDLEPVLNGPTRSVRTRIKDSGWGRKRRSRVRTPVPLQLHHLSEPDPKQLALHVRMCADIFDVWAIVAPGSASDVMPLRNALAGISVPLLVTTDSTTVPASGHRPNELRLMPNNQPQAMKLLFVANQAQNRALSDGSGPLRQAPTIAYSYERTTQARKYVMDLCEQLLLGAQLLGLTLHEYDASSDHAGPVIGIGYQAHAEELIQSRAEDRLTILSDGCATAEVYKAVLDDRPDHPHWFVSHPGIELHELGSKSFSAVREAGRRLLEWDPGHQIERALDPQAHGTHPWSLTDLIKIILIEADKARFSFSGIENVAPAYQVSPIWELDSRGPKGRDSNGPSSSKLRKATGHPRAQHSREHLQVVRSTQGA